MLFQNDLVNSHLPQFYHPLTSHVIQWSDFKGKCRLPVLFILSLSNGVYLYRENFPLPWLYSEVLLEKKWMKVHCRSYSLSASRPNSPSPTCESLNQTTFLQYTIKLPWGVVWPSHDFWLRSQAGIYVNYHRSISYGFWDIWFSHDKWQVFLEK